ncbi:MAG: DMT family transporter [Bdellovibrionaceae bacterium]|nr:DMT family transporter [Pseudobdellovibrionaceae bacterium]
MNVLRWIGYLEVVVASLLFGLLGIFGKLAYAYDISVGELLAFRFTLAAALLWIWLLLLQPEQVRISLPQLFLAAALGIFGYAMNSSLYFIAIRGTSVSVAALLLYTFPLWVGLINHFTGEKITARGWIALLTALLGLILLLWGEIRIDSVNHILAGIGAGLFYALYIIASSRWQRGQSPITSTLYVITFASIGLSLWHQPDFSRIQSYIPNQGLIILGIAFLCTIVPMTLIIRSLQKIPSSEAAVISMIEPISAAVFGMLFFNEKLSHLQITGAFFILSALTLFPRR